MMRHQPGGVTRPALLQYCTLRCFQRLKQEIKLRDIGSNQDQALIGRSPLQLENALYSVRVERVAAESPNGFGGIGDDSPARQCARALKQTGVVQPIGQVRDS